MVREFGLVWLGLFLFATTVALGNDSTIFTLKERPSLVCANAIEATINPLASLRLIRKGVIRLPEKISLETAQTELREMLFEVDSGWLKLGRESRHGTILTNPTIPLGKFIAGVERGLNGQYRLFAGRIIGAVPVKLAEAPFTAMSLELELRHSTERMVVFAPGVSELYVLDQGHTWGNGVAHHLNTMPKEYSDAILKSPLASGFLHRDLAEQMDEFFLERAKANLHVLAGLDSSWSPLGVELEINGTLIQHPSVALGKTVIGVATNDYYQVWTMSGRLARYEDHNPPDDGRSMRLADWWGYLEWQTQRGASDTATMNLSGAQSLYVRR